MNHRRVVRTDQAPQPTGAYSQGLIVGDHLYLAGQAPFAADGTLVAGGVDVQVRQCFANLRAVAAAAGGSLENAIRIGAFVSSRVSLADYNAAYAEEIEGDPRPVRTTIISDLPGFDVEIEAIVLLEAPASGAPGGGRS